MAFGNSLTTIPSSCFENCSSLSSIVWSGSVTTIDSYAFQKCISLTSVSIPDSVTTIGYEAFDGCSSLKEIYTGNGVTKIGGYAFGNCISLEKIVLSYYLSVVGDNILYRDNNVVVYVYAGSQALKWAQENGVNYRVMTFKPSAVTNLRVSSYGKNKTLLQWNYSAGAEGYLVYGQKNGKYGYVGMTQNEYFLDTRALDTAYNFYWVFPYVTDGNGKMIPGNCTKYVFAKGVCPAVTNLRAASVTGGVRLSWSASRDAQGYLVYGMNAANRSYHYVGMTTGATAFIDKKASRTNWNFYWVYPYHKNAQGEMIVGGTPKYVYGRAR